MDCASRESVEDLVSSSDGESEDIELRARYVERQLDKPIPIPTTGAATAQKKSGTPRPNHSPFPNFDRERFFYLGRRKGPSACDERLWKNHPINICRNLIPQVDTPLSPPIEGRNTDYGSNAPICSYSTDTVCVESISNHFCGIAVSETPDLMNYSDCVVCGKSVHEIHSEAVNDYLNKTAILVEMLARRKREKMVSWMGCPHGRSALCQPECRRLPHAMETGNPSFTTTTTLFLGRSRLTEENRKAVQKESANFKSGNLVLSICYFECACKLNRVVFYEHN